MILLVFLQQVEREPRVLHRLREARQHLLAFRIRERLVHATRYGEIGVNLASARNPDDLLTKLAKSNPAPGDVGMLLDETDDVTRRGIAVESKQQIGCAQVEKAEGMGLRQLAHVQEFAQQFRRAGNLHAENRVARFRAGQKMADRDIRQIRAVICGISAKNRPSQNFSNPRNSTT